MAHAGLRGDRPQANCHASAITLCAIDKPIVLESIAPLSRSPR